MTYRVVLKCSNKGSTLSILIPHQKNFQSKVCRATEKHHLISWFHEMESKAWERAGSMVPNDIPEEILLVTGQMMTPKCWISHNSSDATCSIWFENLIHCLPLPSTKDPWIGYDLFPVLPLEGFQVVEGGTMPLSIFLTVYPSKRSHTRTHPPRALNRTGADRSAHLGLTPINRPGNMDSPSTGNVNIIFVHGLGGSAKGTWTHPQTKWFWPEGLLLRKGFESARAWTFGYSSDPAKLVGPANCLDLEDVTGQLLDKLYLHHQENGGVSNHITFC